MVRHPWSYSLRDSRCRVQRTSPIGHLVCSSVEARVGNPGNLWTVRHRNGFLLRRPELQPPCYCPYWCFGSWIGAALEAYWPQMWIGPPWWGTQSLLSWSGHAQSMSLGLPGRLLSSYLLGVRVAQQISYQIRCLHRTSFWVGAALSVLPGCSWNPHPRDYCHRDVDAGSGNSDSLCSCSRTRNCSRLYSILVLWHS